MFLSFIHPKVIFFGAYRIYVPSEEEQLLIYATSDLHGYPHEAFLRLLNRAGFGSGDTLYILGDVIDRNGDGGVTTLRWVMEQPNVELLLGNHEAMMLNCGFLFDEVDEDEIIQMTDEQMRQLIQWMKNGFHPTVESLHTLKKESPGALTDLMNFVRSRPLFARVSAGGKDFLLVHSGLEDFDPARPLEEYEPDQLLWHRPTPSERYFPDVMTILGHTPTGYRFGGEGPDVPGRYLD